MSHKACTFFGHRDCPEAVLPLLHEALTELIEREGVDRFYVGNNGSFDRMVLGELRRLAQRYKHIRYDVVLAYLPRDTLGAGKYMPDESIFPEGMETVPKRYAISRRNKWMIEQADFVITYVVVSWGGAAQFEAFAQRRGKNLISLAERLHPEWFE